MENKRHWGEQRPGTSVVSASHRPGFWWLIRRDSKRHDSTAYVVSGSINWTPIQRLYPQGSIGYVSHQTETPADFLTGVSYDTVLIARNNDWNAGILAGFTLNERMDLNTQYLYCRAKNCRHNTFQYRF